MKPLTQEIVKKMTKPQKRLKTKEIVSLLEDGAILQKVYERFEYFCLEYKEIKYYNFVNGSINRIIDSYKWVTIEQNLYGWKAQIKK
jgi:midasin (ATPase involved in ribosome maturation)